MSTGSLGWNVCGPSVWGTGLAMADWLRSRGVPVEFIDLPPDVCEPEATG